mgnify:CR=1 FL=1
MYVLTPAVFVVVCYFLQVVYLRAGYFAVHKARYYRKPPTGLCLQICPYVINILVSNIVLTIKGNVHQLLIFSFSIGYQAVFFIWSPKSRVMTTFMCTKCTFTYSAISVEV